MSLTKEEALAAAQAALRYPPGCGYAWGFGPLETVGQDKIPNKIANNPSFVVEYG